MCIRDSDYTTDAGTDARNYGDLEGLHEARVLFADVFGVKPELSLIHIFHWALPNPWMFFRGGTAMWSGWSATGAN